MAQTNKTMLADVIHLFQTHKNHPRIIKKLIRNYLVKGFDINTKYVKGKTLGHYLVKYDIPELVLFLRKNGLNLNICDDSYDAPIHKAVRMNKYDVTKALIKAKIDIDIASEFEETALHIAVSENNYVIAKLLIDSGCDISLVDEKNHTALDYALDESNEQMIALLKNKNKRK